MMLRDDHPDNAEFTGDAQHRLNLLLSYGGWRQGTAVDLLPQLLEPMGICSMRVETGAEAEDVIQRYPVHIAVVDLTIPLHRDTSPRPTPAGARILQLLRRLDAPPPTVLVRPRQASSRENARTLADALREGAFAVLDRPLELERMLEVMRRIVRRHYADLWPGAS